MFEVGDKMTRLPIIVGFGGYNAAGRSSFHHAYRRTIIESLEKDVRVTTLLSLATIMKLVEYHDGHYINKEGDTLTAEQVADKYQSTIEQNSLVRRIHAELFDVDNVPGTRDVEMDSSEGSEFVLRRKDLPTPLPTNWNVSTIDDKTVKVEVAGNLSIKMQTFRKLEVQAAGILPTGLDPADHYNSRFHPRGLQLAILGASDALNSMGIEWADVMSKVHPDEVAVYAASGLGQTDDYSMGGFLQARLRSDRPTSKQVALGLNSMPADFVIAYVCGSVGTTGAVTGACASFLYNLRLAVDDIVEGRHRVVICGSSEAPVTPEVMEAFAAMSALGTDERLARLDNSEICDHRRASRPFGENAGFTMGESSQYFVLMDDALAMELGADIYGAVTGVFVNADGFKKSISSPGAGNYLTLAKAVASAKSIVGEDAVRNRSYIQAHGSSTPQNRITESLIFDKVARAFDIDNWPVSAVKAFVGHPLGPASGDQLASTLGTFSDGILPGIKTTTKIADDVFNEKLDIVLKDQKADIDVAFLNSKGFGGNNATATVLSPNMIENMLAKRYGEAEFSQYQIKRKSVRAKAAKYDDLAVKGDLQVIYNFGTGIIDDSEVIMSDASVSLAGFEHAVGLDFENPYKDMID